jgi:hypothetical protein
VDLVAEAEARTVREGMTGAQFVSWMLREGGVVEEFMEEARGAPSPSGQAIILPDGTVELLSTHEQRLADDGVYVGAMYPANKHYRRTVEAMTRKIGRELSKKGVRGRFGVDYIAIPDASGSRVVPIEINVRAGGTTHPFVVAQLLTGAKVKNGLLRREDGGRVVYNAADHHMVEALKGVDVEELLEYLAEKDILYSEASGRGAVFHLLDAIPTKGNVGYTVIGATQTEARMLEKRLQQHIAEFAAERK